MSQELLLSIDCGNTHTVIGLYDTDSTQKDRSCESDLLGHWRISTIPDRTEDELAVLIEGFLAFKGWDWLENIVGFSVASGVPQVTATLKMLGSRYFDFEPLFLEPGIKTGISILYDNPKEVGPDRIANAVGVHDLYGGPSIVADFGTGTTLDVVSSEAEYLGGTISPGVEISLDALVGKAAALHSIELKAPKSVIGKNTSDSLQSGMIYGFAAQVDGLVSRIIEEIGEASVVATGGLAPLIAPHSKMINEIEPWLTLHGLRLIWEMNCR